MVRRSSYSTYSRNSGGGEVAGGCLAFLFVLLLNLAWLAAVVWVVVWVLKARGYFLDGGCCDPDERRALLW